MFNSNDIELFLAVCALVAFVGVFAARNWAARDKYWGHEDPRTNDWESELEPEPDAGLMYSEQEFQEMVANALDEIPEEFDQEWQNVAVTVSTGEATVEDKRKMGLADDRVVLGVYSGVNRAKGHIASSHSRHIIVIYQPALEARCGADREKLQQEIRRVVMHELAHHLGMSHGRMREIGL